MVKGLKGWEIQLRADQERCFEWTIVAQPWYWPLHDYKLAVARLEAGESPVMLQSGFSAWEKVGGIPVLHFDEEMTEEDEDRYIELNGGWMPRFPFPDSMRDWAVEYPYACYYYRMHGPVLAAQYQAGTRQAQERLYKEALEKRCRWQDLKVEELKWIDKMLAEGACLD